MPAYAGPDQQQSRISRLKRRPEFLRAAQGRRAARPGLVLQSCPTTCAETASTGPVRVGFTATRKIGNAVLRNRARRRLRAAAAEILPADGLAGHDYVLIARAGTLTRRFADLLSDLKAALEEVHRAPSRRPRRRGPAPANAAIGGKAED